MNIKTKANFTNKQDKPKRRVLKRGEIYYVNFGEVREGEEGMQRGKRPAIFIGNNQQGRFSPTKFFVPITSSEDKTPIPTQYYLANKYHHVEKEHSIALCEQIQLIHESQVLEYLDVLNEKDLLNINIHIFISFFGLGFKNIFQDIFYKLEKGVN